MKIESITEITDEILNGIQSIHSTTRDEIDYRKGDTFFIAREKGVILGYAHSRFSAFTLLALYVLKEHRNSKINVGSSLLLETLGSLKTNGVNRIQAGIEPSNKEVIPFYEKYGFGSPQVGKTGFTTLTYNAPCQNT